MKSDSGRTRSFSNTYCREEFFEIERLRKTLMHHVSYVARIVHPRFTNDMTRYGENLRRFVKFSNIDVQASYYDYRRDQSSS